MTCNQMILLLQIYRGTMDSDLKIGTYESDLGTLIRSGYVEINRHRQYVTAKATRHIRQHVLQEMVQ